MIVLKRNQTPRDVVGQLLDYASWVQDISYDEIAEIYGKHHAGRELEEAFTDFLGINPP